MKFQLGKPAGAFPFTDKMVKDQEQDINREHAARDSQKKKKQGTQLTCTTATSYLSSWELRMQDENTGRMKHYNSGAVTVSDDLPPSVPLIVASEPTKLQKYHTIESKPQMRQVSKSSTLQ
uniref:Uncharacterized protein n=1 Tax=Sphaerodactylus townsendi TaxID=933632 RepID=A0ACB8FML0_9SAUR